MPPHLHPRSRLTSSLFATTLFASFFVVALPHALPCPAPRVAYADDGTGQKRRRRRRKCSDAGESETGTGQLNEGVEEDSSGKVETEEGDRLSKGNKRECPVPKPGGIVGEILGFKSSSSGSGSSSSSEGKGSRPP